MLFELEFVSVLPQAILDNPKDHTQISLLYANVSEKDILLKDKLDALAAKHPNFTVHYGLAVN